MTRTEPTSAATAGERDLPMFCGGTHARLFRKPGRHLGDGPARFAVWAPNAGIVAVIGDFNGWQAGAQPTRMPRSVSPALCGQGVRRGAS